MAEKGDDDDEKDDDDKTEEPSERKLDQAREQGQFIFSREVGHFWAILALTLYLVIGGGWMAEQSGHALAYYVEHSHHLVADGSIASVVRHALWDGFRLLGLPILCIIGASFVSSLIQLKGIQWTLTPLMPQWQRLSFFAGFKRMFSKQALVELIKGLAKVSIVGGVAYWAMAPSLPTLVYAMSPHPTGVLRAIGHPLQRMLTAMCVALFFLAIFDYLWVRFTYYKKMRMTREEMKKEIKQTEGDPEIKARRKKLRIERLRQQMKQSVPKADVVITNPTHFSVALLYDIGVMQAPTVVAKGEDEVALMIREIAREHEVPLIENAPLARALYASTKIGEEIPLEHYRAVAEIITYVYRLKGKSF